MGVEKQRGDAGGDMLLDSHQVNALGACQGDVKSCNKRAAYLGQQYAVVSGSPDTVPTVEFCVYR
jgi:hypothetical protein